MLKLAQPGVAHAKIVQGNANAGITQRLKNRDRLIRVVNASTLRHFQGQGIRFDAVTMDQLQHLRNHGRVHKLHGRQIDRQRQRYAALLPGGKLTTGLFEHPVADGDHQAAGLDALNQPFRQLPCAIRLLQTQQGLGAFYLSRPQIHLRLQPEGKLAVIQRGQDVTLFRQALLRLFHLRRVEELDLVFPFAPGGKGRREGAAIKLFRGQVAIEHGNPDTGTRAKLDTLNRQPLINDSEYLLT